MYVYIYIYNMPIYIDNTPRCFDMVQYVLMITYMLQQTWDFPPSHMWIFRKQGGFWGVAAGKKLIYAPISQLFLYHPLPTYIYWLVVDLPLWKIWGRQFGWWHSQLNGKIIHSCSKPPSSLQYPDFSHLSKIGPTWIWRMVYGKQTMLGSPGYPQSVFFTYLYPDLYPIITSFFKYTYVLCV